MLRTHNRPFAGYNLRGLIFDYLESCGWRWSEANETWTLDAGRVVYSGVDATDNAIHHQTEREERA